METEDRATFDDLKNAPVSLPEPKFDYNPEQITKFFEQFGALAEKNTALEERVRQLQGKINTAEILDKLIEPYANRTFWFMVGYCGFVGAIIAASGTNQEYFHIDPDVLKILVGSTAVTVIGLVGMILTGVFVGARKH